VLLITSEGVYSKSDAVLEMARRLGSPWALLYAFRILPHGFRDAVYDLIAKYRYRIFGRRESCWLPTPELRARFLDIA
jgi:predicted DCC family thiol-disulfide oxidoreductase YuxK